MAVYLLPYRQAAVIKLEVQQSVTSPPTTQTGWNKTADYSTIRRRTTSKWWTKNTSCKRKQSWSRIRWWTRKKGCYALEHTTQEDPTTSNKESSTPLDIGTIPQAIAMRAETTCNNVSRYQFLNTHRGTQYADETVQAQQQLSWLHLQQTLETVTVYTPTRKQTLQ